MKTIINLLILLSICCCCSYGINSGQEIAGCGGFIKSFTKIDYSKVEVQLYTKQGSLKDRTDCSPSNGYYFLPLYNKGEYILKISPPTGWSFEPDEIPINFDGKTDSCSLGQDLNFIFKGFGITGVIAVKNLNSNGAGVTVKLQSEDNATIKTTTSDSNGVFYFTPVFPGKYFIEASHDKWSFVKARNEIIVKLGNTELPRDYFVVSGFTVDGQVLNDNHPIENIGIVMLSSDNRSYTCDSTAIPDSVLKDFTNKENFLCYKVVARNGIFSFSNVAPGKYTFKPYIANKDLTLHMEPESVEIEVKDNSVVLNPNFHVTGFNVMGKVLTSPNGPGLANAKIKVGELDTILTAHDGTYTISNIKTGTYVFQITSPDFEFSDYTFRISTANTQLPNIVASAYKICGQIVSKTSYLVQITGGQTLKQIHSNAETGDWCTYLPKGSYKVEVLIGDEERLNGVQFFPLEQNVEVTTQPISGLIFSQLRAHVTGKVKCLPDSIEKCNEIIIHLYSLNANGQQNRQTASTKLIDGKYEFTDIAPGTYEISIVNPSLCWETTTQTVNIQSINEIIPTFIQTGYLMSINVSHTTQMRYKPKNQNKNVSIQETTLVPGLNKFCVPNNGQYEVFFIGCHVFDLKTNPTVINVGEQITIVNAVKHTHGIKILSQTQNSFRLMVERGSKTEYVQMTADLNKEKGFYIYRHDFQLASGQELKLTPQSEIMLFKPTSTALTGSNDCVKDAFAFVAYEGTTIKGSIVPPIEGVELTCEFSNNISLPILKTVSDENGLFKFGPIDIDAPYKITANKKSYVFTEFDEETKTFKAHKLCEIEVTVKDDNGNLLSGVLLSLSGAESYRKNVITADDGKIRFHSLSPSQYFLRPMMKEYKFDPASKIINVKDGETLFVELIGKRVAYSMLGSVTSLNGEPFPNIIVESNAEKSCSPHQEEASTDQNGFYKILGLQSNCQYSVQIKQNSPTTVDRTIPEKRLVTLHNEELKDINIYAISPVNFVDVTVRTIATHINYYKSLKVQLYKNDLTSRPVHTQRVDSPLVTKTHANYGVLVYFPRIPLDGATYFVEVTSTTMSEKVFQNVIPVETFVANESSIYLEIDFTPKARSVDGEINQQSLYALFFLAIIAMVLLKPDVMLDLLNSIYKKIQTAVMRANVNSKKENVRNDILFDDNEIEKLAQTINLTKKKNPKK